MGAESHKPEIDTITPEAKAAIRQSLASVLTELKSYDGSAVKYEAYLAAVIAFENILKTQILHLPQGRGIPVEVEQELLTAVFGERSASRRTIDALLDHTNARYTHIIQQALRDKEHQSEVYYHTLPGVLLPPGQGQITTGTGEGNGFEQPTFKPRLEALLLLLKNHGIHLDHIGIFEGGLLPNQLRQASYRLVELSSPLAQILICDQVGEATFVIRPRLSRETLLSLTKEQLQTQHPTMVTRVIDSSTWDAKIIQALFTADATESQPSQPKKSQDKLSLSVPRRSSAQISLPDTLQPPGQH